MIPNFIMNMETSEITVFGINFISDGLYSEGCENGYAPFEVVSEKIGYSVDDIKNKLIEYEILTKDGEINYDEDKESTVISPEDGSKVIMNKAYLTVIPVIGQKEIKDKTKEEISAIKPHVYINISFARQFMELN